MGDATPLTMTTYVVTDTVMSPGLSGVPLTDSSGNVLRVCALVRPTAGGIGNYAVSTNVW